MPLYEYRCTVCEKLTEKRQKFSDPEITDCPRCGGLLERTITAPAIQFKGGGWYADLYSSGKKPASADQSSESGKAASDNGTSGESKGTESQSAESKSSEAAKKSETSGGSVSASPPASTAPVSSPVTNTAAK